MFVGGPFAGQTVEVPPFEPKYSPSVTSNIIGPLAWFIVGPDRHCYQLVSNGWYSSNWRLVYRDTF